MHPGRPSGECAGYGTVPRLLRGGLPDLVDRRVSHVGKVRVARFAHGPFPFDCEALECHRGPGALRRYEQNLLFLSTRPGRREPGQSEGGRARWTWRRARSPSPARRAVVEAEFPPPLPALSPRSLGPSLCRRQSSGREAMLAAQTPAQPSRAQGLLGPAAPPDRQGAGSLLIHQEWCDEYQHPQEAMWPRPWTAFSQDARASVGLAP